MKAMQVAVMGSTGKMGQEVLEILRLDGRQLHSQLNKQTSLESFVTASAGADVVIDFSTPDVLRKYLGLKNKTLKGFVSGTTGLTESDFVALRELSVHVPVLWAPNFSLGICFMNELLKKFAALKDFDFQIEEIHHNKKKDAPSGTAILLQKTLQEAIAPKQLPEPLSVRAGGVFGVHKVMAISDQEQINLEHIALKRSVFARGAVTAAEFIVRQKPGLYQMKDVLDWIG